MMKDLTYVRILMKNKTDTEIEERLERLKRIGKGPGFLMYDDLTRLLEERRTNK